MMMRFFCARWNSVAKLCPTFSSVLVKPGRSELVESDNSASTPFLPYSPMVTRSVGPPEMGV